MAKSARPHKKASPASRTGSGSTLPERRVPIGSPNGLSASGGPGPLDRRLKLVALLIAAFAGTVLFWFQYRSIYCGEARGFDTMIYARGIWGVARGIFWNSVRDANTFAVHANVVNFALAPFTYVLKSATVMAIWQSTAFGVTTFAVLRACQEGATTIKDALVRTGLGFVCGIVTPAFVINPFLFDARPDLMLTCFVTLALLRVRRVGDWDGRALLFAVLALMCREEVGVLAAFALWTTPRTTSLLTNRKRAVISVLFVAYTATYFLGVRAIIGNLPVLDPLQHFQAAEGADEVHDQIRGKLTLIGGALLGGAPFIWRGWRWLISALPAVAVLAKFEFDPIRQIALHYTMFCAPSILLAIITGIHFYASRKRTGDMISALPVAVMNYFVFGVMPGGHFYIDRYQLQGVGVATAFSCTDKDVIDLNNALNDIPPGAAVLLSSAVGARMADRRDIYAKKTIHVGSADRPDYIIPAREEWQKDAQKLGAAGYRWAGYQSDLAVILTRNPDAIEKGWKRVTRRTRPQCDNPRVRFSSAGIEVCDLKQAHSRIRAQVHRFAPAQDPRATGRLSLQLEADNFPTIPIMLAYGLAPLTEMPVGAAGWFVSVGPVRGGNYRLVLRDADKNMVPPDPK